MAKVTVRIPTPLRPLVGERAELILEGDRVSDVLRELCEEHQGLREQLLDGEGRLRNFVNVYLNDRNIRDLESEQTPLADGEQLSIVPSIAGGRPAEMERATGAKRTAVADELTPQEIHRYIRHLTMPSIGLEGQRKLKHWTLRPASA